MDLNLLLHRHQLSLMIADGDLTSDERRAYDQFTRDNAQLICRARDAMGARPAPVGFVT